MTNATVTFRTERECCDGPPIRYQSDKVALKRSTAGGVWIRSHCCGAIHFVEKLDPDATRSGVGAIK